MTSFVEIVCVYVADRQKLSDPLGNTKQNLANVLREGENLLLS